MLIKAATVMIVYALALVGVGWLTMHVAPPGSRAITALIVPAALGAASIACAVMTLMGKRSRRLGMIGIHVGLLVPILGAAGAFMRLGGSVAGAEAFNAQLAHEGAMIVSESGEQAVRNTAYQAVALGATGALSVVAFVSLILHRPRVPKPEAGAVAPTVDTGMGA
jgi:phosphotransferase system  glucose/maltose/N-acetylglucosamine-specific IIC component